MSLLQCLSRLLQPLKVAKSKRISVIFFNLSNCLSLAANWTTPFDPFHTWPGEFVGEDGIGIPTQMMHQKAELKVKLRPYILMSASLLQIADVQSTQVAYMQDMRAVTLPCGPNGETAVTFVVPNFGSVSFAD